MHNNNWSIARNLSGFTSSRAGSKKRWLPFLLMPLVALADDVSPLKGPVVELHGHISAPMDYRAQVDFATTANNPHCKFDDHITGMSVALRETVFFPAQIDGGEHRTRVSLEHPQGVGVCGWRPVVVSVCVGARAADATPASCHPLYLIENDVSAPPSPVVMYCDTQSWICTAADGSALPRQAIAPAHQRVSLSIRAIDSVK